MDSQITSRRILNYALFTGCWVAAAKVDQALTTNLSRAYSGFRCDVGSLRNRTTKLGALFSLLLAGALLPAPAGILSQWTFEGSVPTTAGPVSPEAGNGIGTAFHADPATVYSHPAGNGSDASWSANRWAAGDYFQFQLDTLGYQSVMVSWDQTRSSDGPSSFDFAYSLDGNDFTVVVNNGVSDGWSSFSVDLSSLSILNNASAIYFRLSANSAQVNNNNFTSAGPINNFGGPSPDSPFTPEGTSQIDNFTISATAVPDSLPWPVTAATFLAMIALSRRFSARRCSSWL